MATGRRIAALGLLERVERHEMETDARRLGALRAEVALLEGQRNSLLDSLRRETVGISLEAAPYVGGYIESVREEVARLEADAARLEEEAGSLEDRVRGRFREMKTFATAREAAEAGAKRAREHTEGLRLEEQALQRWIRAR